MTEKIICPVCGYNALERPIHNYDVCPSCLCEFGVSDADWTYAELREDWIANGALWAWGSKDIPEPRGWSAVEQLKNIDYHCTLQDIRSIARFRETSDGSERPELKSAFGA